MNEVEEEKRIEKIKQLCQDATGTTEELKQLFSYFSIDKRKEIVNSSIDNRFVNFL